jgi:hypothetical protein
MIMLTLILAITITLVCIISFSFEGFSFTAPFRTRFLSRLGEATDYIGQADEFRISKPKMAGYVQVRNYFHTPNPT